MGNKAASTRQIQKVEASIMSFSKSNESWVKFVLSLPELISQGRIIAMIDAVSAELGNQHTSNKDDPTKQAKINVAQVTLHEAINQINDHARAIKKHQGADCPACVRVSPGTKRRRPRLCCLD
jgi:hypothetical protein